MWITLKIGVFYGAPALAVVLALAWLAVLLLRVRRGQVTRPGAALRACWVLALPVAAVVLIWFTGEVAGYFSSTVEHFVWDPQRSFGLLRGLLPIGIYVGAAIAALLVLFWIVLALLRPKP